MSNATLTAPTSTTLTTRQVLDRTHDLAVRMQDYAPVEAKALRRARNIPDIVLLLRQAAHVLRPQRGRGGFPLPAPSGQHALRGAIQHWVTRLEAR